MKEEKKSDIKKYITIISLIVLTISLIVIGRIIGHFLLLVFISFILACALEIPVKFLQRRGISRRVGSLTILMLTLLLMLILVGGISAIVIKQANGLIENLDIYYNNLFSFLAKHKVNISKSFKPSMYVSDSSRTFINHNLKGIMTVIGDSLLVIIFTYYFIVDGFKFRKAICLRLPRNAQEVVLRVWEISMEKTGAYFLVRVLVTLISTLGMTILAFLLNMPYFWVLGLWFGLISQSIPIIGTYLGAALPLMIAVNISPWLSLLIVGYVIVFQLLIDYLLLPKLASENLDVHPVVILGSVIIGGTLLGIVGVVVAIPVAATIVSVSSSYLHRRDLVDDHHLLEESIIQKEKLKIPRRNKN